MSSSASPPDALPVWSRFYGVVFDGVAIAETKDKGSGLVAEKRLEPVGGDAGNADDVHLNRVVLSVPPELLVNSVSVEEHARQSQNFRDLLDVAGRQMLTQMDHKSSRRDVLLFLLSQMIMAWSSHEGTGVHNPWTQYIKYLPRDVPLPTLWTEEERHLLAGTSLEAAVQAKLLALQREFNELLEKAIQVPFWDEILCESQTVTFSDYIRADAWYRSRCMELPQGGSTMVPCVDMVNHSANPTATYVQNRRGGVDLCLQNEAALNAGDEVTITYGEKKAAAEMLFSYGFVDAEALGDEKMLLPIESPEDDPLAMAKARVYGEAGAVRISRSDDGGVVWDCPYAYLLSLNEEDGLEIRLLQLIDGSREIRLYWQDEDVTESVRSLEAVTRGHANHTVFQLRAVVIVEELLQTHLERISAPRPHDDDDDSSAVRRSCAEAAARLRDVEARMLRDATDALESEKSRLLQDDAVVRYLGSMEVPQNGVAEDAAANEETDFS